MSIWLVVHLLIVSMVGPNVLHLCADGCVSLAGDTADCVTADRCCDEESAVVAADPAEAGCAWCFTVEGEAAPMILPGSDGLQLARTAAAAATLDMPCPAPCLTRLDRPGMATGPPPAVAHLRTVRLLI